MITSKRNPGYYVPVNENGQAITTPDGKLLVEVAGSKVLKEWSNSWAVGKADASTLFGENQGTAGAFIPLNVSQFKTKLVRIKNSYNTSISYQLVFYKDAAAGASSFESITIASLAAGATIILDPITQPKLNNPYVGIGVLLATTATAPTTGTHNIDIIGGTL